MAKTQQQPDPQVGDTMFYFAHPRNSNEAHAGPYVARVVKVNPAKEANDGADPAKREPAQPLTVDLEVRFSANDDTWHKKTGVQIAQAPERYRCTRTPSNFDFDQFIRELSGQKDEPAKDSKPKA